jgi:O-antigen/teichoic acid export membrane protein
MNSEAQSAVRNSGMLLIQRGLEAGVGLLIALIIPRLMGPETYGQYALITSISLFFVLTSRLGFREVISRYVPQLSRDAKSDSLREFFSSLVVIRVFMGLVAAGLFFFLTRWWLEGLSPMVLALTAGTVLLRAVSQLMCVLFVGLNRAGRWGVSGLIRRWLSFVLVAAGFWVLGFEGAMVGWLVVELFMLGLGITWTRSFVSLRSLTPRLRQMMPFLRFGMVYFASGLFLTAFRRSGEVLVQVLVDDYVEVGYFGLAYNIYLSAALVMPHLTLAFAPFLSPYADTGQKRQVRTWAERLLKGLAMGAMLVVFATLLLAGDLVPIVLGTAYQPVAVHMIPLTLALLFLALSSVAQMLLLVFEAPKQTLIGSIVRLAIFWLVAIPLIRFYQSLGACIAVLIASVAFSLYLTYRAKHYLSYTVRGWTRVLGAALPFLGLVAFRDTLLVNIGLYAGFVVGYAALLFGLRLVPLDEIGEGWRIVTGSPAGLAERIDG